MLKFTKHRAGEYFADSGNLRITVDKCESSYLGWQVFIVRNEGDLSTHVYTNFHQTFTEAKADVRDFAAFDSLAPGCWDAVPAGFPNH